MICIITKDFNKFIESAGEKPYKCDKCDYSTVERSHLRVHDRVHTGKVQNTFDSHIF